MLRKKHLIKITIAICIVFINLIGIVGCSSKSSSIGLTTPVEPTNVEPTDAVVEDDVDYSFIRNDMSNFNSGSRFYISGGWIYSVDFNDNGDPIFIKMRDDGTEYTVLTKKGEPCYISVSGEFIYSVIIDDNSSKIFRCRLGGNDFNQISNDDVWHLQVTDDYLYYDKQNFKTGKTIGFYRSDKDGKNETLIMDKEIYYSFVIGDVLYYQDDNDNETIHKYNMKTKEDIRITNQPSYCFVVDNKYGYYIRCDKTSNESNYTGSIVKINLSNFEEQVLYSSAYTGELVVTESDIYFANKNDNNRIYSISKDGKIINLVIQDTNCDYLACYNNKLIYYDFDNKYEYVDAIFISNIDGSNKIEINKN